MKTLVLLRHGESIWNKENRFTGWTDVDLSEKGIQEATLAGEVLKREGYSFDVAFTSVLRRAIRTLWIVQDEMDLMWIPVNIPTGIPLIYELDGSLNPLKSYYLGDPDEIKEAKEKVIRLGME